MELDQAFSPWSLHWKTARETAEWPIEDEAVVSLQHRQIWWSLPLAKALTRLEPPLQAPIPPTTIVDLLQPPLFQEMLSMDSRTVLGVFLH